MNYNCSIFWDLRNLEEQVKKAFCYQKLFWPFTVWINCSNDLKNFEYSRLSASNFKSFSRSLEQFFLTVGQNNFGNKLPLRTARIKKKCLLKYTTEQVFFEKLEFILKFILYFPVAQLIPHHSELVVGLSQTYRYFSTTTIVLFIPIW